MTDTPPPVVMITLPIADYIADRRRILDALAGIMTEQIGDDLDLDEEDAVAFVNTFVNAMIDAQQEGMRTMGKLLSSHADKRVTIGQIIEHVEGVAKYLDDLRRPVPEED